MPERRLAEAHKTLPEGYQFGADVPSRMFVPAEWDNAALARFRLLSRLEARKRASIGWHGRVYRKMRDWTSDRLMGVAAEDVVKGDLLTVVTNGPQ